MKRINLLLIIVLLLPTFSFAADAVITAVPEVVAAPVFVAPSAAQAITLSDSIASIFNVIIGLINNHNLSAKIIGILSAATIIIGHASGLVKILSTLGIDPNSTIGKDAAILERFLTWASSFLSKVALNPKTPPSA